MVIHCRKNFVREIFAVTDTHENFLTAKLSGYMVVPRAYAWWAGFHQ